ncbi:MAG: glutamate--tRNA ligase [bacterium]
MTTTHHQTTIRLRFAPSPSGYLHVGGARTALFNWLLARKEGGVFILRIEDTDQARSSESSIEVILDSLRWLGLDWDEGPDVGGEFGPYRQLERKQIYLDYAAALQDKGHAYCCYCTAEELEARRVQALEERRLPGYDGRCRSLSSAEAEALRAEGRSPVIRFKVPEERDRIVVDDKIRGRVEFDRDQIRDFVIVRSNGLAAYNFAATVDDALMKITHVIRGDDHLSNTPRQILLYEALGFELPVFAHIPMILGEDGQRLSKRHGATSVGQYRQLGYLPEAVVNYLALRGWSPEEAATTGEEIYSLEELVERFSLERVTKNPAIFDTAKLNWMNGVYLQQIDLERVTDLVIPYLRQAGFAPEDYEGEKLREMVDLVRGRLNCLSEIAGEVDCFFNSTVQIAAEAVEVLKAESSPRVLNAFREKLMTLPELDLESVKEAIKAVGQELGMKGQSLFMPIRVALSGQLHGPELVRLISVLGRDRCLARIKAALLR